MSIFAKVLQSGKTQVAIPSLVGKPHESSWLNCLRVVNFGKTNFFGHTFHSFFSPAAFFLALSAVLVGNSVADERITGHVVGITDGDTITVFTVDRGAIKVRLASIDTPEKQQDFGTRAREAISALCFHKEAEIMANGRDRDGRTVGIVSCDGIDAGEELVRQGLAWVFPRYAPKNSPLYRIEHQAREETRGLWADPSPIPPWEWRRQKRKSKNSNASEWATYKASIIGVCNGFGTPNKPTPHDAKEI